MGSRSRLEGLVEDIGGQVSFIVYPKPESRETKLALEGGELVFYTHEHDITGRLIASLKGFICRLLEVNSANVAVESAGSGLRVRVKGVSVDYVLAKLEEAVMDER